MVQIVRLDHVQLAMPTGREAEAIAFYDEVLGIPHVAKPAHLAARGGCWFERGDLKVHLGVEQDFRPATKAHPAFIVEDVRGLAGTLAAAGGDTPFAAMLDLAEDELDGLLVASRGRGPRSG